MYNEHILIVEDEDKIARILADYLKKEGFETRILNEGTNAVEIIQKTQPLFLILDLMLPGKDGLSICREVRQFSNVPILMLTARVDEIDRLSGLETGADDYVCKPFLPREVVARVRTILRRTQPTATNQTEEILKFKSIELCRDQFRCTVNEQDLELTPVEFRMLQTLITHPGHVHSRDSLMHSCYPDDRIVSDRTIDSHIKNLRRKITELGQAEELIHSIYGVGYKIE